jgi:hypothetical protein
VWVRAGLLAVALLFAAGCSDGVDADHGHPHD